jgi:hypothetical protein
MSVLANAWATELRSRYCSTHNPTSHFELKSADRVQACEAGCGGIGGDDRLELGKRAFRFGKPLEQARVGEHDAAARVVQHVLEQVAAVRAVDRNEHRAEPDAGEIEVERLARGRHEVADEVALADSRGGERRGEARRARIGFGIAERRVADPGERRIRCSRDSLAPDLGDDSCAASVQACTWIT